MENFADRLLAAVALKGSPVCVGVDPVYEKLPPEFQTADSPPGRADAIARWCLDLLDVVAPHAPAVKPQSACFEAYGPAGAEAYAEVIRRARQLGLLVIGDVKRNDIGSTAEAYARGHLLAEDSADAVTVNAYLGRDGIQPFAKAAAAAGKGLFVLVRTSNPSAADIQDITDAAGRKVYQHMAALVASMGGEAGMLGRSGYSCMGAVVGATYPDEARQLRKLMPQQIFLVPGYGAQGATAGDCAASFKDDGTGAIVNASRSVIFAHGDKRYAGIDWKSAVDLAAKAFAQDIRQAVEKKGE